MDATAQITVPVDDLQSLREKAEANSLRLQIVQQEAVLRTLNVARISDAMESYYDPANYVDLRDYLGDGPARGSSYSWPTSNNDRQDGKNLPIFQTERELATIRGAARLLATCNGRIVGALNNLANYIIAKGFDHKVSSHSAPDSPLVEIAQRVIDDFKKSNGWNTGLSRELFIRSRRDGEYFLGLWHQGGGRVAARVIEPDQVTEPGNKQGIDQWLGYDDPSSWSFGIHSDEDDAVNTHGYYVQWSSKATDWDYLPGGLDPIVPPGGANTYVEHLKVNVDRNVKRGLSDLFAVDSTIELARKVLRNTGEGGALQAAIAWIKESAPGTTRASLEDSVAQRADLTHTTRTANGGARTHYTTQYDPGTVLLPSPGTKYTPGPMGSQNAPNFLAIEEALLRAVAVRWNMPEHMLTGSAHNNNFASILVSGDPFVMAGEVEQIVYKGAEERIMWKVLYFAHAAGLFGGISWGELQTLLKIDVKAPEIAIRDPEKETNRRSLLNARGVLSLQTWTTLESLDFEQEQANFAERGGAPITLPATGNPEANPSGDPTVRQSSGLQTAGDAGLQTELTLNGAQVDAARNVLLDIQLQHIAPAAAIELLVGVGIPRDRASAMVNAQSKVPPPATPEPVQAEKLSGREQVVTESERDARSITLFRRLLNVVAWRDYP